MKADVERILQRAREPFSGAGPRIISDNGPQFIARDFKESGHWGQDTTAGLTLCRIRHILGSPSWRRSSSYGCMEK